MRGSSRRESVHVHQLVCVPTFYNWVAFIARHIVSPNDIRFLSFSPPSAILRHVLFCFKSVYERVFFSDIQIRSYNGNAALNPRCTLACATFREG